jgi:hypothetical protein
VIYSLAIYDESGARATVISELSNPTYSRSKNTADQLSMGIPRNSVKIDEVKTGRRFEILRTINGVTELEASGFISNHGYSGNFYDIEGYTEEIVLTRFYTPAQFGYPLYSENASLEALARQLDKAFVIEQVKYNWDDYIVSRTNIDTTSVSAFMLLTKDINDDYEPNGTVTMRFEKAATETWDRFRWVSDYYEDDLGGVTTKFSFRTSNTLSFGAFSTPQAGALTDIVGIIIPESNHRYLEIKIDFETDTTESSPVVFSLELVKRTASTITSFDIQAGAALIATPSLSADNASFFDVLVAACEPSGWEFKVVNGKLYLAETFGVDRTNDYSVVAS